MGVFTGQLFTKSDADPTYLASLFSLIRSVVRSIVMRIDTERFY